MTNKWDELARQMRESALGKPEFEVLYEKVYEPSEEQKKLYFNAGRWAGGSRDYTARQAHIQLQELGDA